MELRLLDGAGWSAKCSASWHACYFIQALLDLFPRLPSHWN